MSDDEVQIIVGNIVHCVEPLKINVIKQGFIIVVGSKIVALGNESELQSYLSKLNLQQDILRRTLKKSQILIPGLVDTHIHAPQYPNCGLGYDKPLLDWLNSYTYKLEQKYSDVNFSRLVYKAVVRRTLSLGTTTACYFGSLFNKSTEILVDTVLEYGQRALVGKINMTQSAPENYQETPTESIANTKEFIKYVYAKNSKLVVPVITPRFALSVDMELMQELGKIAKEENLHIQTHISENVDEVELVEKQYGMPYAQVYDTAQLLTPKTILAHGIYLSDSEIHLIADRKTSISHCPDSNVNLKSGSCAVRNLLAHGISVGLGTDVSGGTSPSMMKAMKACIDNSINISFYNENYVPLNYEEAFYLATIGGAKALALDDTIGNFEVKKDFDALIIDMHVEDNDDYLEDCTPEEILQKFIYVGDDRNVINVFVAGVTVK